MNENPTLAEPPQQTGLDALWNDNPFVKWLFKTFGLATVPVLVLAGAVIVAILIFKRK